MSLGKDPEAGELDPVDQQEPEVGDEQRADVIDGRRRRPARRDRGRAP